jgi:hypothetical protein
MTDWTAFGVPSNVSVSQNTSFFAIGENLSFSESFYNNPQHMINITAASGVRTFSMQNLSFGLVTYPSVAGLLSPKN